MSENKKGYGSGRGRVLAAVNAAVILTIIGGGALFMTFGERPEISAEEKRSLAKCPEFTWESYFSGGFTSGFAAFYNDTVPMRSSFKLFISQFRSNLGIKYDGVNISGSLPEIDKRPDSPPSNSENSVPDVVRRSGYPKVPEAVRPDAANSGG